MKHRENICCFGEILWDCFSYGKFIGGAPLNTAYHLKKLNAEPIVISSVGNDHLGKKLLSRMKAFKLSTQGIRIIPHLPTGTVNIVLGRNGNAKYEIVEPVAWDEIIVDERVMNKAKKSDVLIYSTLACRKQYNKKQLKKLFKMKHWFKVLDANFRPPYDSRKLFFDFASYADLIKLNKEELYFLIGSTYKHLHLAKAARVLSLKTGVSQICVTQGGKGAGFLNNQKWFAVKIKSNKVKDTVGAGDSFLAVLALYYLRFSKIDNKGVKAACRLGSYVAVYKGATPNYKASSIVPELFERNQS